MSTFTLSMHQYTNGNIGLEYVLLHVHLWYDLLVKGCPMFNCFRIVHVIVNGDIFLELSMKCSNLSMHMIMVMNWNGNW